VHDLYNVSFKTFTDDIETTVSLLKAQGKNWKKIIVIGDCFGSYVASHVAERLGAHAIVMTSTPYHFRSPLSWWIVQKALSWVRSVPKLFLRTGRNGYLFLGYHWIPGNVFKLVLDGNAFIRMALPKLGIPLFAINLKHDRASLPSGAHALKRLSRNESSESHILESDMHVVHTSDKYRVAQEHIILWIERILNIEYMPGIKHGTDSGSGGKKTI
jgi:esterase/lipase